jgi:hypothetical protein
MKSAVIGALALGLFVLLPSVVHAQVVLPVGVGIGMDCQGDDASPAIPPGGVSNVLALKRMQWGPTNNSLVQKVTVWCRLNQGVSGTKLRVNVYDRNPGSTSDTSVSCHARNLDSNGNTVNEETAFSGGNGVGSGLVTINFNTFNPFFGGPNIAFSFAECTLPPSVDANWPSHLVSFFVNQ